jgi:phosphatidylglycerophosphate synthase
MQLSSTTVDLVTLVGFVAIFAVPFIAYLGLVAVGAVALAPQKRGGAGRRLFGPLFIGFYYWFLGPVFRLVSRTSLSPNAVTGAALVVAMAGAVAIATGHFALASALLIGGATLDIIDGHLARAKNLASPAGAFLDSTVDRICDGLIFSGCAVYYAGTPMMYVALAVLVMSFTVSYTRARGEALGLSGAEGLMQRADRIVVLGLGLAFGPFFAHRAEGFVPHPFYAVTAGALCLLALFNTVTAIARIGWTMQRLGRPRGQSHTRGAGNDLRVPVVAAPSPGVVSSLREHLPPIL